MAKNYNENVTLQRLKQRAYSKIAYWNKKATPKDRLTYRDFMTALDSMGVDTQNTAELFEALLSLKSYKDLRQYVPEPEWETAEEPSEWEEPEEYYPALDNFESEISGFPTEEIFKQWLDELTNLVGKRLVDEAIARVRDTGANITRAEQYDELSSRQFMSKVNSEIQQLIPDSFPRSRLEAFENAVITLNENISVQSQIREQRKHEYNPSYERQRRYYERNKDLINARRRMKRR